LILKKNKKNNDKLLLELKTKSNKDISLSLKSATQNVVCLGSTGSGKTVNIILPAINNLIKNNCAGLIMDIKAEICQDVLQIAKDHNREKDIVFVGTESYCQDFNLLSSITNKEQLRAVFSVLKPNDSNNAMWFENGKNDFTDMITLWEFYCTETLNVVPEYDIRTLLNLQNDKELINKVYRSARSIIDFDDDFNDDFNDENLDIPYEVMQSYLRVKTNSFSIYNAINSINPEDLQQMEWRSGQVASILGKLCREPFYSKLFNPKVNETLKELIFDNNKIVVMVIPQKYSEMGFITAKLLRQLYFNMVLGTTPEERATRSIGSEFDRYLFLVIDEYQKYIETITSDGILSDDEWVGISRSYGNINLFASQSISSLISGAGNDTNVHTLLQNCVNTIDLMNKDKATVDYLQWLFCEKNGMDKKELKTLISPISASREGLCRIIDDGVIKMGKAEFSSNEGKIYYGKPWKDSVDKTFKLFVKANNLRLKEISDYKKSFVRPPIFVEKIINGKPFISGKVRNLQSFNSQKSVLNIVETLKDSGITENLINKFTICPYNFDLKKGWEEEKKAEFNKLCRLKQDVDISNLIENIDDIGLFGSANYETFNDMNGVITLDTDRVTNDINNLHALYKENINLLDDEEPKIIIVFRGGGDKSDKQFNKFKQFKLIKTLREYFPNSYIFSALGHANDVFSFDLMADFSFTTPTDCAYFIKDCKEFSKLEKLIENREISNEEIAVVNTFRQQFRSKLTSFPDYLNI